MERKGADTMKNYLLCVGGTGTRVLRAVMYSCASGVIQEDEISVMVIDADQESVVWERAKRDWEKYQYMHSIFMKDKENTKGCFKTNIRLMSENEVISPVNYSECRTLRESLYGNQELERIMKWLYTEEEMNKDLKEGFFARPNVGCVFFSHFKNRVFKSFLEDLTDLIYKDEKVNVMLAGSIFGGTGASGLPTILKLIDRHVREKGDQFESKAINNLNVGAVFMLPYFTARQVEDVKNPMIELNGFNNVSKESLKYYREGKYFKADKEHWSTSFQSLYLVGQDDLDLVNVYAEGGRAQDNKPHIAEECAALAVYDFLLKAQTEALERGNTKIFSYKIEENIGWLDLPCTIQEAETLERKMGELARFATVYCTGIYEYMNGRFHERNRYILSNIPQWYVVYIHKNAANGMEQMISDINEYCKFYLEWIYMIQTNMDIDADGEKKYYFNEGMKLFGKVLSKINEYLQAGENVENIIDSIKEIKKDFKELVCLNEGVGYSIKEIFLILSKLGIIGACGATGGIAGLITGLYQLVG